MILTGRLWGGGDSCSDSTTTWSAIAKANSGFFADETNEGKLRQLLRRMRAANRVPSKFGRRERDIPLERIIEDPVMRQSKHSYFIQVADLAAHALYQKLYPKGSLRRYNVDQSFDLLDGILLKEASRSDPQGIVHL